MPDVERARVIGRYSEIFLKRGRRRYFLQQLARNARRALKDLDGVDVRTPHGRVLAQATGCEPTAIVERLGRVFGLNDLAPVRVVQRRYDEAPEALLERIADAAVAEATPRAAALRGDGPLPFRVTARRSDKLFPMRSEQIAREIGSALYTRVGDLRVDLSHHQLEVEVELRPEEVYVCAGRQPAPGGLPVGSNGRAMLLLSGGIDSPVAGWLTLKRGVQVDAVTFDSFPLTGPQATEKVRTLCRTLARWSPSLRLHVVPFGDVQLRLRDAAPDRQLLLLYRRSMIRLADALARKVRAQVLVTGESIGQVASQTLPNMRAIEAVTLTPVLRPVITYDKIEIVELARRIGTYETSVLPHDDCCSLFVPPHPELNGSPPFLQRIEEAIEDLGALEEAALARAEVVDFPPYGIG